MWVYGTEGVLRLLGEVTDAEVKLRLVVLDFSVRHEKLSQVG